MATDEQIERVRGLAEYSHGLHAEEALAAVLEDHAKLKRLATILQRAVDDQRPIDVFNGVVDWYDDAVAALAELATLKADLARIGSS